MLAVTDLLYCWGLFIDLFYGSSFFYLFSGCKASVKHKQNYSSDLLQLQKYMKNTKSYCYQKEKYKKQHQNNPKHQHKPIILEHQQLLPIIPFLGEPNCEKSDKHNEPMDYQ